MVRRPRPRGRAAGRGCRPASRRWRPKSPDRLLQPRHEAEELVEPGELAVGNGGCLRPPPVEPKALRAEAASRRSRADLSRFGQRPSSRAPGEPASLPLTRRAGAMASGERIFDKRHERSSGSGGPGDGALVQKHVQRKLRAIDRGVFRRSQLLYRPRGDASRRCPGSGVNRADSGGSIQPIAPSWRRYKRRSCVRCQACRKNLETALHVMSSSSTAYRGNPSGPSGRWCSARVDNRR